MDVDRTLRFSIPPFILLSSLALYWGTSSDGTLILHKLIMESSTNDLFITIFGTLIAGGGFIVPSGFLISTLGYLSLRFWLWYWRKIECLRKSNRKRCYWCGDYVSSEALDLYIKKKMSHIKKFDYSKEGYCAFSWIAHNSDFLPDNMNKWFSRRWNTLLIHVHSIIALFLAWGICFFIIQDKCHIAKCGIVTFTIAFLMGINGYFVRREASSMWEFFLTRFPSQSKIEKHD